MNRNNDNRGNISWANDFEKYEINITKEREKIDKNGIVACLKDDLRADFYMGVVIHAFYSKKRWIQKEILREFGATDDEVRRIAGNASSDLLQTIAEKVNRPPLIAAIILGKALQLKPEYCFSAFPEKVQKSIPYETIYKPIYEPVDLTPKLVDMGEGCLPFQQLLMDKQNDLGNDLSYAVCHYSDRKTGDIFVFAVQDHIKKNEMMIGVQNAPLRFLSHDLLIRYKKHPVLLCADIKTALYLRLAARQAELDLTRPIITGFVGDEEILSSLPYSALIRHPVTIVADPKLPSWQFVNVLVKQCQKNNAINIRIYPWPLALMDASIDFSDKTERQEYFREHTRRVDSSSIAQLLDHIKNEAMSPDELEKWKQEVGIEQPKGRTQKTGQEGISLTPFGDLPDAPDRRNSSSATLRDMFCPQYATLIWGPSNAGKSWVSIALACALATGTPCFCWAASPACKICYLDGEVGQDFKIRGNQLVQGQDRVCQLLDTNMSVLHKDNNLDILDDEWQNTFIEKISGEGFDFVFIDNILSLAPKAIKDAKPFLTFIDKLKLSNIGVVAVHHTNKGGKDFKGPVDLESLSQNVISLEGREHLEKEKDCPAPLRDALAQKGPVVRMFIKKCKVSPELEGQRPIYRLPVDGKWEVVQGIPIESLVEKGGHPEDEGRQLRIADDRLSASQMKAYEYFRLQPDKDIQNKDIQRALGVKEGAARNVLKSLVGMDLIERFGENNQTRYRLKK